MVKYSFMIHGYILDISMCFLKAQEGIGDDRIEALFDSYYKIKKELKEKNIRVTEMMVNDYILIEENSTYNNTGFSFYPMNEETIIKFKEDEERVFMSREDKY